MERVTPAVLLVAGIGGSASNLLDLATTLTSSGTWEFRFGWLVGVIIFCALGSFVAWVFEETDRRRAFFVGLSMPALISAAQTQATARQSLREGQAASVAMESFLQVLPVLHAESQGDKTAGAKSYSESSDSRTLRLELPRDCPDCMIRVYDAGGKILSAEPLDSLRTDSSSCAEVGVSSRAATFGIWNGSINPRKWTLPHDREWEYRFNYRGSFWNDLRRGLGDYNRRPYIAEVTPVDPGCQP